MTITAETVRHIAKLSALELSDAEVAKAQKQIGGILDYMDQLSKVNTDNIEPTLHLTDAVNAFREDIISESLPLEKLEKMSENFKDGFFKVPKFINN